MFKKATVAFVSICFAVLTGCTSKLDIGNFESDVLDEITTQIAIAKSISDNFLIEGALDEMEETIELDGIINQEYLQAVDDVIEVMEETFEFYRSEGEYMTNKERFENFIDPEGGYDHYAGYRGVLTEYHYGAAKDIMKNYSQVKLDLTPFERVSKSKSRWEYVTRDMNSGILFFIDIEKMGSIIHFLVTPDQTTLLNYLELTQAENWE